MFFFQAEDGIRDIGVTGVQTCALPIYREDGRRRARQGQPALLGLDQPAGQGQADAVPVPAVGLAGEQHALRVLDAGALEIGRASWRERVSVSVGAASLKKKKHTAPECT